VAARLLQEQGPAAVTTRGVARAAGVQPPAIYRLFGDKDGLLEAVAEHVMATYVSTKAAIVRSASADEIDPLDDLRSAWQTQLDFGVTIPALFRLFTRGAIGCGRSSGSSVTTSPTRMRDSRSKSSFAPSGYANGPLRRTPPANTSRSTKFIKFVNSGQESGANCAAGDSAARRA
jgi:hypothetical protein